MSVVLAVLVCLAVLACVKIVLSASGSAEFGNADRDVAVGVETVTRGGAPNSMVSQIGVVNTTYALLNPVLAFSPQCVTPFSWIQGQPRVILPLKLIQCEMYAFRVSRTHFIKCGSTADTPALMLGDYSHEYNQHGIDALVRSWNALTPADHVAYGIVPPAITALVHPIHYCLSLEPQTPGGGPTFIEALGRTLHCVEMLGHLSIGGYLDLIASEWNNIMNGLPVRPFTQLV